MSNKLKAAKKTAMMLVLVCIIPIIVTFLFSAEVIGYVFTFGLIGLFVWAAYSINLAFIEFEEKTKDRNKE
jgi:hypothetical protein